jgi:hypothetical protein
LWWLACDYQVRSWCAQLGSLYGIPGGRRTGAMASPLETGRSFPAASKARDANTPGAKQPRWWETVQMIGRA